MKIDKHGMILCDCKKYEELYPCTKDGKFITADIGGYWNNHYLCMNCGSVFDVTKLKVIKKNTDIEMLQYYRDELVHEKEEEKL